MKLTVDEVSRAFGGVYAVRDVSLTVAPGELRAVIGPNGAGKSTLFALIGGQLAVDGGTVALDGVPVERRNPPPPAPRGRRGGGPG
ncbi:ATP-binding cassette domain-containing protein, partial [Actinoplanes sp. NEAU-A12]